MIYKALHLRLKSGKQKEQLLHGRATCITFTELDFFVASMTYSFSLPDEILTIVLGHLDRREDRKTILALRLVDEQCDRLARPLIYCTLHDSINQHRDLNAPAMGPLQQTAWDIVQHPELATFIKAIRFDDWDFIGRDKASPLPEGAQPPSKEQYSATLASANLPSDVNNAVIHQLYEETPAGHISLLLALCTDIEDLEAPAGKPFGSLVSRILLQTTKDAADVALPLTPKDIPTSSFRSLRQYRSGTFLQDSPMRDILPLLCLPQLRDFQLYGLGDSHTWTDHGLPERPSKYLTYNPISFVLDSCMISGPGLSCLLSACSSPKALTIRWRPGTWNDHLSNEPIGDAIREDGKRLEFLHIDTTDVYEVRRRQTPPSFGSFASLPDLKTLAIPRYAFKRLDCTVEDILFIIPPNLEKLYVLGVGNEAQEEGRIASRAFEKMLSQAKDLHPRLRKAVIVPWFHFHYDEYWGRVKHQGVDYRRGRARGLALKRTR